MKKEGKKGRLIGLAVASVVLIGTITGCMSMAVTLAKSMYKDYGVFDKSVPEDQLAEFRFIGVNVKSFNGTPVKWGDKANNMGFVRVPAGTHDIVYDWVQEETKQTGSSYNPNSGTTTVTYTTTTRSQTNLEISQITFLAGHNYSLAGGWIDGQVRIYIQDVTNTPSEMFGDTVGAFPKESKTPTEFEGTWKGTDNTVFKFTGNTWEWTIPPGVQTNYSKNDSLSKGTFEIADGKITMYLTHAGMNGKWYSVTAIKQACIWTYSFDSGKLNLEIEYLLPNVVYTKQ